MSEEADLSSRWLDYLSGRSLDPGQLPPPAEWQAVPPDLRRLSTVRGIGGPTVAEGSEAAPGALTRALLAGLAGEFLPFAFEVIGNGSEVRLSLGTWAPAGSSEEQLEEQMHVTESLIDGLYPRVDREPATPSAWADLTLGAIGHGVPGLGVPRRDTPWDRLLRSLPGQPFGVLVLAEPVEPDLLSQWRATALEDLRAVTAAGGTAPSPLLDAFADLVAEQVKSLDRALASGGWRTGVYLLGDPGSSWRLTAAWRASFAEDDAGPMPLRTVVVPEALELARGWALPYAPAPPGPGRWQHPFLNQSLLDTSHLAALAHFPRQPVPGFAVRPAPLFAVGRPAPRPGTSAVVIGEILQETRPTGSAYSVDLDQLTRHAFVAGLTGSGKTNTIMNFLQQAARENVPFLVIEPAKTEYRELLGRPGLGDRLQVFTVAREQVAPLRLNPFEVPAGIDVGTHLDLLKAVFAGSFALWIPLPQVLEQCLVELYTERGWAFTTAGTTSSEPAVPLPVPTLSDLVHTVERIVPTLGYKAESTQEITASLTTRLNQLRRGSRGAMLDVRATTPIDVLLQTPTVIELEGLGDDADKAFVMGLLLVRLYEQRRSEHARLVAEAAAAGAPAPPSGRLRHLVVVEEAHRLLTASKKQTDAWHADPQGAFSDAFAQMLSEVRAYGQGIVIADQVPVRLAPDAIKNTNLKIAHRIVSGDDREALASSMSMDGAQARALPTLRRGEALVFSEGDDLPLRVAVPKAKDLTDGRAIDDAFVARRMTSAREAARTSCSGVCPDPQECLATRQWVREGEAMLLADRLLVTAGVHPDGIDSVWPDVEGFVAARLPPQAQVSPRVHAFALHASEDAVTRLGIRRRWPPEAAEELEQALREVVNDRAGPDLHPSGRSAVRTAFVAIASRLLGRDHDPYRLCTSICPDHTCRYRDAVSDALRRPRLLALAEAGPAAGEDADAFLVRVAGLAARDLVADGTGTPAAGETVSARWRSLACAAQVLAATEEHPLAAATRVARAVTAAGWQLAP